MSFLTTRVVSRRSLLQSRVHLFSTPAINNVEIKSKLPPFQTPLSSETTNAVGKYYHSLLYKGRQVTFHYVIKYLKNV